MTNMKNTKRALSSSVVALLLCFSMLLGTTFAWFTDSVTSGGNIIQSGNLDVEMLWKDATATGKQQTYKDAAEGAIFNYDKWEPGYVEAKNIKISNVGTLALKYQLAIVPTGEASELSDVIDVYYAEGEYSLANREMTELTKLGTLTDVLANMSLTANGDLLEGETDTVTIALKMQESANNDYQNLSIGSEFAIKCLATQLTSEDDSFDDQYDAMATIDSEAELLAALAADYDLITLGANINATSTIVIPADKVVTIDLSGYSISQVNAQQTAAYALIDNQGTLTIKDSVGIGKISYTDTTPYTSDPGWASNTIKNTGTLTINGGTVENLTPEEVKDYGYPHAIDAYQGSVTTINGGTVKSLNYDSIRMFCNSDTLATKVVINGGTIVNRVSFQDPHSTRPGYGILEINGGNFITANGVTANVRLLNFCANCSNMKATVTGGTFDKGFMTQDIVNSGIQTSDWLNMGSGIVAVSSLDELHAALNAATDGAVIKLAASIAGEVLMPGNDVQITLDGNGCTINGCVNLNGSSNKTLKNIKFDAAGAQAAYDAHKGGTLRSYANIIGSSKGANNGAHNIIIDGCVFTGKFENAGAAIAFADRSRTTSLSGGVIIKNCTFDTENANYDVYGYYTGTTGMTFTFENNTFASECRGSSIYLGRLKTNEEIVVKGNIFETKASVDTAVYVQGDSGYTPTFADTDNTFAE